MADPFVSLLSPSSAEHPSPRFVVELYRRLEAELVAPDRTPDGGDSVTVVRQTTPPATPCLVVRGAGEAIAFYEEAFGAVELPGRVTTAEGRIDHTEFVIGTSRFALAEEDAQWNKSPATLGGSSVPIALVVSDADALFAQALAAGAEVVFPLADRDYGFRAGRIADPFGHLWIVSAPLEPAS